ncbi:MAG TPA: DUF4132 domain-containing protein, partial [Pirellulaceae bacterium]|nr:DUF4132 domain-containing protein [Pirellulaceae bacterium]
VLALVEAPEAVVPMLQCRAECRDPGISREWLEKNVGHAIRGAIVPAAGKGQLAESAMECLQTAKMRGFRALIEAAVVESPDRAAAAKIRAELLDKEEKNYAPLGADTPEWLVAALAQAGKPPRKPLPTWATPGMLPLLLIGDKRLNDEQTMTVIQTLAASPLNASNPLLVALRTHLDKHVRDAFAWGLFQRWQQDGYDSADKWAMTAIGHLGDDGCALKITPLIRVWPGESQHARAVLGLECLRAIGSNMALMQLSGIAQKLKFKGLKAKAEQFVEEIAKQKGLTRAELEDRVVPDCGLDERGRREFSFGPRSFSFVLGGDLKPMIRDADGKQRPDLPKPSSKDDATAAEESIAEWKLMKKQIKEVATIQSGRLEAAMVTGRRWKTDDFVTLFVHHPLLTLLAQKLIWATFDSSGRRTGTFRVTDERDFATVEEDAFDIGGAAQVGVVHALELTDDERAAWGQVLGDYNIVTPFPQLGREIHSLKSGEQSKKALSRYKGASLVAPTLVFTLEKLGWIRG